MRNFAADNYLGTWNQLDLLSRLELKQYHYVVLRKISGKMVLTRARVRGHSRQSASFVTDKQHCVQFVTPRVYDRNKNYGPNHLQMTAKQLTDE